MSRFKNAKKPIFEISQNHQISTDIHENLHTHTHIHREHAQFFSGVSENQKADIYWRKHGIFTKIAQKVKKVKKWLFYEL